MFKPCILLATLAAVFGAPAPAPGFLTAPVIGALPSPILTASSSQFVARNYNNLAVGPIGYVPAAVAYPTHAVVSI